MTPLPFLAHGLMLSLAWFLTISLVVSAAAAVPGVLALRTGTARSAGFWIALRLLPSAAAFAFVVVLFVPSYWTYEPREFVEGFDLTLALVAVGAAAVIAVALARGAAAWRSAARRADAWMRHARPLSIGAALPAFAIEADQPIIALVGVWRPRLLVTRGLIEALTAAELDAAVAHEVGHLRAFDNLKRLLMRSTPDLLAGSSLSRAIERRWAAAAEHHADRIGGADGAAAARCALASALVKVARLTPPPLPAAEPISLLIAGGDIASRVRTLIDDRDAGTALPSGGRWMTISSACAAVAFAYGPLLRAVHEITELAVRSLP